ncbi:MAG: TonB-dependent receptor [Prevotellaceae bacterium]|nr:TonB-dependent receptor [Prevotellaceae bacterium]
MAIAEANYKISGIVCDAQNSEPIEGVTVFVKNWVSKGTSTNPGGSYTINNLPAGTYTLVFSFVSYQTVEVECVLNKDVDNFDISLETELWVLDDVVVKARRRSNTENSMINTIKAIPQVVSGISAAQISRNSDNNASEVIKRIPGITIIDERFIIVRGLSQRYNNTWINGLAIPSTETDSRAFSFDLIPGSQIDNLLVYKSPSPEIPGDFSGGFVKITTKAVPDENTIQFNYTTGFNFKIQFNDFYTNPGSSTDFLGFDADKRPLKASFPTHLDAITNSLEITEITKHGFNKDWRVKKHAPLPDQLFSFMLAHRFNTKNSSSAIGNVTAITYSNINRGVEGIKNARYGIYSVAADMPVYLDNYKDNQYTNSVRIGAMHNWSFVIDPANRIEFKNLFNLLGKNRLTERSGVRDVSSMQYREQTEMLYSSRLSYTGQLSGVHDFAKNDQTIDWTAGYSYAHKGEPDRRIVANLAGIGSPEDIPNVIVRNENITRYYQNLNDHIISASLNYKRKFSIAQIRSVFKVGVYAEYRKRAYSPREFIYRYDNLSYDERQTYLALPFREMLQEQYLGADKVYIDEITRKTNAYTAKLYHSAAYVLFDIPVGKLAINAGMRLENHDTRLIRDRSDASNVTLITTNKVGNINLLPSVNLVYKINNKRQLKAAYGRSLNRPEIRELSPTIYYDFDLFSEIGGNENLQTAFINNFDLRYEVYPELGEVLSIGAFYKHFKNPIEWTFIDMGGSLRYLYENANKAISWGFEIDIRKKLDFIGLNNLSLILNAAWIESNVSFKPGEVVLEPDRPMQGQSPYVINAGIYYSSEKLGLNMALLYNRIGKRIVGLGKSNSINPDPNTLIPDSYEMPRNVLDFIISKSLGEFLEIRLSVKDILSEYVVYKQFPKFEKDGKIYEREQTTRRFNPGQSISIGVSFKL